MNIDFKKGLINGVILFVAAFVGAQLIGILNLEGIVANVVSLAILGAVAYVLAGKAALADTSAALTYGILTAVVLVVINYALSRSINLDTFALIGYALVVLAPLAAVKKSAAA